MAWNNFRRKLAWAAPIFTGVFFLGGCNNLTNTLSSLAATTASPSPTASTTGPKAVKIFLSVQNSTSATSTIQASFDQGSLGATSAGTSQLQPGQSNSFHLGLQPTEVFHPDGSPLAYRLYNTDGTPNISTSTNWPSWLQSFDIGISGLNNPGATNPACARFTTSAETGNNCKIGPKSSLLPANCNAPLNQFRISEADCSSTNSDGTNTTQIGTGGPNDGIYLRAVFNRGTGGLSPQENILVVIEYLANSLNPAPADPSRCLSGNTFTLETCSDFVWRAFLKHNVLENQTTSATPLQPFFLFIPPMINSVIGSSTSNPPYLGVNPSARQIILPLAIDPALTVFQLSRISSYFPVAQDLNTYCNSSPGSNGSNTPLCAGIVFYSVTFYRI